MIGWHVVQARDARGNLVPVHFQLHDSVGCHAHSASKEGLQDLALKLNAHDDLVAALREAEIALKHCAEFFHNFPRLPESAHETVRAALAKAEAR